MFARSPRRQEPVTDIPAPTRAALRRMRRRAWKPSPLTYAIMVLALAGLCAGLYPMTAAWVSSYNQSQVIEQAETNLHSIEPNPARQFELAHEYNDALTAGVKLEPGGNVPVGSGNSTNSALRYADMLKAGDDGFMARVKIPASTSTCRSTTALPRRRCSAERATSKDRISPSAARAREPSSPRTAGSRTPRCSRT